MHYVSLAVFMSIAALAQSQSPPKHTQYGLQTERGGTRVAYWDNEKNASAGEAAISYGRPAWKPEYADQLDAMTSGKIWRMGENFWTTLDANIPLRIGGVDVAAGYYYLVVKRSADGADWSLGFVDPAATRKAGLDPFEVETRPAEVPVRFEAPLEFQRLDALGERLVIDLNEDRFAIRWGTFALSAPVEIAPR